VLHVFEDWSTYTTVNDIGVKNRVDGGGPWQNSAPGYQSFSTTDVDPWFGKKSVIINYQDAPPPTLALQRGFTLTQNSALTPARYLNESRGQASLIIEWAYKEEGVVYFGKVADWQPTGDPLLWRFNFQTNWDRLGDRDNPTCDSDPLCSHYYTGNGTVPRLPGLEPAADYFGYQFARDYEPGGKVVHWVQNRNFGSGPGQYDYGSYTDSRQRFTSPHADNTWYRIIIRLTLNQPGQTAGHGRVEQWIQHAGEPAVKVMEFYGDVGAYDEGLIHTGEPGSTNWINDGDGIHWYDLTATAGNFNGGLTLHLGYFRMWSMPRQ
jgi:hypothetical protein